MASPFSASGGSGNNPFARGGGQTAVPYFQPQQQQAAIQASRIKNYKKPPKGKDTEGFFGSLTPDILELAISQIATSLMYTPVGLYDMGKAITKDQWDLIRHLDVTPERTMGIGEALVKGTIEDFRNPMDNPGYLAMDIFALASGGLGGAARLGRGAAAVSAAGGKGASAARLMAPGAKLPRSLTEAAMRPMGISAPDGLTMMKDATVSVVDQMKARAQQVQLRRQNAAKEAMNRETLGQLKPGELSPGQQAFRSQPIQYSPTGRPQFGTPFTELQLPGIDPINPRRLTPLGRPEGYVPSGVDAGPDQPLFPRPGTATLMEGEVPGPPISGMAGQQSLFPEAPVPMGIQRDLVPPLTPHGSADQQARLDANRAAQEYQAYMKERVEKLQLEPGTGPSAGSPPPFIAGPRGVEAPDLRSVLGREANPINPPGFSPVRNVPGEGLPIFGPRTADAPDRSVAPTVAAAPAVPDAPGKKAPLEAPDVMPSEIKIVPNPETKAFEAHFDGKPTGITAHRVHRAGDPAATYVIMDGDKPIARATAKAAKTQIQRLGAEKLSPGIMDRIDEAEGATDAFTPVSAKEVMEKPILPNAKPEDKLMDAIDDRVKEMKGERAAPAKPAKPAVTLANDGDEALRKSVTDAQLAATGDLPGVYKHEYTSPDGVMVLRNSDKKDDFKVYDTNGKELKGAEWSKHKTAAIGADRQKRSAAVSEAVRKGETPKPEDVKLLRDAVPEEMIKLGLDPYSQKNLGINPRALKETFNITTPQATALARKIHPGVREIYKRHHTGELTIPKMRKELMALLKKELGDEMGGKAFSMLMSAKGGVDIGPRQMSRIFLKAALAPRPRQTLAIKTAKNERVTVDHARMVFDDPEAPGYIPPREIKVTKTTPMAAEILISNNPIWRMYARSYYGVLQGLDNPYAKGGSGNYANRRLRKKIDFENREIKRMVDAAEAAGITAAMREAEKKLEAKKAPKDLKTEMAGVVDTTNQLAQIGILFFKPAYYSANFIGQVMLSMNDHSWNPVNVAKSVNMQRELYGKKELAGQRAKLIKKLMGEGFVTEMKTGPGVSRKIEEWHTKMASMASKVLDTPFRDNAFLNEARRQGFDSGADLGKLLDDAVAKGPGSDEFARMTDIARRANRNLIDYGRLNNLEKTFVRRMIFFYPWMKGATIYGARFAAEHPVAFGIQAQMGKQEAMAQAEKVGDVPSYLRGVFKHGERSVPGLGKVPTIINPAAVSLLGTPAEALYTLKGVLTGSPAQSETIGEMFTPAASAAFATAFNIDPFTGRKLGPGEGGIQAAWDTALRTPAPLRLMDQLNKAGKIARGEMDTEEVLFPTDRSEAWGRFLGPGFGAAVGHPMADYAINPREARSRAVAEKRSLESKTSAKKLLWRDYRNETRELAKNAGIKIGKDFDKAMSLKAEREAALTAAREEKGQKLNTHDRLLSDLGLLVRMGKMSEKDARNYATYFATRSEDELDSFRRDLGDQYFGRAIISSYRSYLSDAGVKVPFK